MKTMNIRQGSGINPIINLRLQLLEQLLFQRLILLQSAESPMLLVVVLVPELGLVPYIQIRHGIHHEQQHRNAAYEQTQHPMDSGQYNLAPQGARQRRFHFTQ